ncbi:hypothetical protein LJC42_05375 [Eubacteriales bacterium OttesenSCG-928-K08]|nr:hypothetical protein [Eubacteriales bacterium OttesenSCG-928-K08]
MRTEYPVYKTGTDSIFVELTSNAKRELIFGQAFVLEKKRDDGWYSSSWEYGANNTVVHAFTSEGWILPPKQTIGMPTSLGMVGMPLEPGEYRIIKNVFYDNDVKNAGDFCAYFEVCDDGWDTAYLSGYASLEALPRVYSAEQAIANGDFYTDTNGKVYNAENMKEFLQKSMKGINTKIRIFSIDLAGDSIITDITYRMAEPRFQIKRDATRTKNGGNSVQISNYRMLGTAKQNGKTGLYLVNTKEKAYTMAQKFEITPDISKIGKSLCNQVAKHFATDGRYTIYSQDEENIKWFGYGEYFEKEQFAWERITDRGSRELATAVITDDDGMAGQLLYMRWLDSERVELWFSSKEFTFCQITFDVKKEAIVEVQHITDVA